MIELIEELRLKGFRMKGRCIKGDLDKIATEHNIRLQIEKRVTLSGCVGENKGILQVLWERGFVVEAEYKQNKNKFVLDAKEKHKDESGKLLGEYKPYFLRHSMAECADFENEKSAMAHLFDQLSSKGHCTIELLVSPKYHCEIAGEGIEFVWGLMKKNLRPLSLKKKGKATFEKAIEESVRMVTKEHANKFSGRCRWPIAVITIVIMTSK